MFAVFSDSLAELWAETAEQPGLGAPTMKSWEGYRELRISISRDDSGLHPPIYSLAATAESCSSKLATWQALTADEDAVNIRLDVEDP